MNCHVKANQHQGEREQPDAVAAEFREYAAARANTLAEFCKILGFGFAGFGCSGFLPLCISLSRQEFPRYAAMMSGEIVAFYQAGYGVAAFGVGPLREFAGFPFQTIYSVGSFVAAAMLAVAVVVVARVVKATHIAEC